MKFLIVGASGFIGRHTLAYAKSLGYDSLGTRCQSKYPGLITFDLLRHPIKDCIDVSFYETDEPVYGVICATFSQIDRCFREREVSSLLNVENTIRLIRDLKALGIKPVFLSSSFVYDGSIGYYNEEYPPNPINEYGRHKVMVENFINRNTPNVLILRLDKIVGDDPLERHLFSEWYQCIRENQPITCIEGQLFSPTLVKDVAKAVIMSCQQGLTGLYNVANSEFFTREELARQFILALGKEAKIICKPQKEFNFADQRPLKSYLDSTKFVKITSMRFTSMREVFRVFIDKIQSGEGR